MLTGDIMMFLKRPELPIDILARKDTSKGSKGCRENLKGYLMSHKQEVKVSLRQNDKKPQKLERKKQK